MFEIFAFSVNTG